MSTPRDELPALVAPPAGPAAWTDATRARMVVADEAAELADRAAGLVPIAPSELLADGRVAYPGERLQAAAGLVFAAEQLLAQTVVVERLGGVSWERIGAALQTSKQAAHERFSAAERRFRAELARPENPDYSGEIGQFRYRLHPAAHDPETAAARLDGWVRDHLADDDPHPVSGGLVRADPDGELRALADRRHALYADDTPAPTPAELLPLARRELALWEQTLSTGSQAIHGLARDMIDRLRRDVAGLERELGENPALVGEQEQHAHAPGAATGPTRR